MRLARFESTSIIGKKDHRNRQQSIVRAIRRVEEGLSFMHTNADS